MAINKLKKKTEIHGLRVYSYLYLIVAVDVCVYVAGHVWRRLFNWESFFFHYVCYFCSLFICCYFHCCCLLWVQCDVWPLATAEPVSVRMHELNMCSTAKRLTDVPMEGTASEKSLPRTFARMCACVCVYVARTRYRTTTKKKCENRRESNFLSVILLCGRTKSKNVLLPIKRRSIDVNWIHSHKMWSFHWPLEWFALIANGEETCETNLRV